MRLFKPNNFSGLDKELSFISGCPHSGTSMLTKIIDALPNISILMESFFETEDDIG